MCFRTLDRMPLFNGRGDASRFRHDDNVVPFQSLVRFLLDYLDVTRDFVTFEIRGETAEAVVRLAAEVERYRALREGPVRPTRPGPATDSAPR